MLVSRLPEEFITQQAKENWLSYWKHFSHKSHTNCSEVNCLAKQEQAIFISRQTENKEPIFVIPLCKDHSNNYTDHIEIHDEIELIPIDLTL